MLRRFANLWVIGSALVFALLLLGSTLGLLWLTRPGRAVVSQTTAVINVIPAPTATPLPPTPTLQPTLAPTQPVPPAPAPGVLAIGATVQISGTGGDGLRLRDEPGLDSRVRLLGAETEVFRVEDGPRDANGYTWWLLVGFSDDTRRGWAVANYLAVVQNP
jgi:hypothetical protein